jgi:hypothetical protein
MGTDSVRLFNKELADKILAMAQADLVSFLDENLTVLRQKPFVLTSVLYEIEESGDSVASVVERLLASDITLDRLRSDLAQDFGAGDERIPVDYWGCYAEVFAGHPEGSISSFDYLPDEEEETFLLLRPEHVGQMVKSLREHADDLRFMSTATIDRLEEWKEFCVANSGYWVAYEIDFWNLDWCRELKRESDRRFWWVNEDGRYLVITGSIWDLAL